MSKFSPNRQLEYYSKTALSYDREHATETEHLVALDLIAQFLVSSGSQSLLDVGCGTGRGIAYLQQRLPDLRIQGVDPSRELLNVAVSAYGIGVESLHIGDGHSLPFPDGAFDAVMAIGVLHHVESPDRLIREMSRISSRALFLSDMNMYGFGSLPLRLARLAARELRLIDMAQRLRHRGTAWVETDGDGLSKSMSLFDCLSTLAEFYPRVLAVPTKGRKNMYSFPLLNCNHLLAVGLAENRTLYYPKARDLVD